MAYTAVVPPALLNPVKSEAGPGAIPAATNWLESAPPADVFSRMVACSADGIIVADKQNIVRYANPAAQHMFGGPRLPVIGMRLNAPLAHGVSTEVEVWAAAGHEGEDDSEPAFAEIRVVETDWEGAPAYLVTLRDVTARKRETATHLRLLQIETEARVHFEQDSRMKDQFLAMLSHELRTPMTAIVGWMKMIRSGRLGSAQVERGMEVIYRNVKMQARLTNDLLDMSAIVTGKLQIVTAPLDLSEMLCAIAESQRVVAESHNLTLVTAIDCGGTLTISGDKDRLHQVICNLINNAIKFTPQGGRVTLGLRREDSHAVLSVTDTGVGINPAFLPRMFDRFSQDGSSRPRVTGGMGLGLAIARQIIELHGGAISASSPGEGGGATFTVRLPVN